MLQHTKLSFILIFFFSINGLAQENVFTASSFSSDTKRQATESESNVRHEKTQNSNPTKQRGGFVVAAYLGAAKTAATDLNISQPALNTNLTFKDVRLSSRSFDPPLYYGLRAGYFFPQLPFLGIEAEFIHLKVYSNPQQRVRTAGTRRGAPVNGEIRLGDIVQQYSISHGANFLLFNAAARRGFFPADANRNRLILTARAGLGPTIPHTESNIEGNQQEQYEIGRLGWQTAGGAELKLFRGLYALGEYKYTQTRQRGKIFSGTAQSFLRTHHGVFGLSYHF
ncbi:MAG: outer membrane beta-barrel protein [Acidobacteriota bacterium]|nr:outer membrane beta-barrel protein [Acidobacteriota bacterium]